jgi:hypothetical protein
MSKGLEMYKFASLTAALALVATSSFAGGPTIVEPEAVVAPVAIMDEPTGSLGGYVPWLIGAAVLAAVVIAADDESSSTPGT